MLRFFEVIMFLEYSEDGLISVLNQKGEEIRQISVVGRPEISGITFSKLNNRKIYLTDNTVSPFCVAIEVPDEEVEKDEGF
jgi:hypothetical protein